MSQSIRWPWVARRQSASTVAAIRHQTGFLRRLLLQGAGWFAASAQQDDPVPLTILASARTLLVVREQRVTTPDGRIWHVRRRWARRQPPWRRRHDHELGPAEVEEIPLLPADEVAESYLESFRHDLRLGLEVLLVLAVLGLVAAVAGAVLVVERVVPFLVDHAVVIGAGLAALATLVLLDRLTRPWFIEAESGRMFQAPRRVWRVSGWWRARRAFRAVVEAVAEGRIDSEHGVIMFTDPSAAP